MTTVALDPGSPFADLIPKQSGVPPLFPEVQINPPLTPGEVPLFADLLPKQNAAPAPVQTPAPGVTPGPNAPASPAMAFPLFADLIPKTAAAPSSMVPGRTPPTAEAQAAKAERMRETEAGAAIENPRLAKAWAWVNTPLARPFPRTDEAAAAPVSDAGLPDDAPSNVEMAKFLSQFPEAAPAPDGHPIEHGVQNVVADNLDYFTSPLGLATLGIGWLPKAAQTTISAGFMLNAARQMPGLYQQFAAEKDTEKKTEIAGQMVTQGLIIGGGVAHVLGTAKGMAAEKAEEAGVNPARSTPASPSPAVTPGTSSAAAAPIQPVPATAPAVDLFGDLIPKEATTPEAGRVQPVATSQIAARPELMQFKRMDEPANGTNSEDRIATTYNPMKAGVLLLWEPKEPAAYGLEGDQKFIVANGHHRYARALEDDVATQNAQIVREADGYSANDARTLAAEVNIADGKGTIYDQAKFFRNTAATHGQDEAVARAGQIGARGRKAASIAFAAGDPLFESFINERVTPDQAEAIASAAPGNDALQRLGILRAREGDAPDTLSNFLHAVIAKAGTTNARQLDLFGADDTAMAEAEAEAMGRRAATIQREIREQIASVAGAARRPEKAKALGVDISDPGSVQRQIEVLNGLKERWAEWSKDPALIAMTQDRARSAPDVVKGLKQDAEAMARLKAAQAAQSQTPAAVPAPAQTAAPVEHGMGVSGARAPTVQTSVPNAAPPTGSTPPAGPGVTPGLNTPAPPSISMPATRNWLQRTILPFQKVFAPHTIDPMARAVGNIIRDYNGEAALAVQQADHELAQARANFDKTPVPANWRLDPNNPNAPLPRNYAFIDDSEHGGKGLSPADRKLKGQLDGMIDKWIDEVHKVAPKALQHLIQDYFPHLWTDPKAAQRVYADVLSKRPLEGSKAFMKERTHMYFRDGLAAGLKPVHDNPIDLFLMKMHEVRRFIMAQKILGEAKEIGARKFVFVFERAPEGWTQVDDRTTTVNGPPFVTVKEAFDAQLRGKTLDWLQKMGIPHDRLVKIAGHPTWWGKAVNLNGGQIESRFAGPDQVIWHEAGHVLEYRYGLSKRLTNTAQMRTELTNLARERATANASQNFHKYIQTTDEKMATVLQAYLGAPELMERVAPAVKAEFAKFIQERPELHDIEEIKPGLALGTTKMQVPVNGMVTLGHYYMPEGAAQVLNNFLSPGLSRFGPVRSLRAMSNILNAAQLGFSGFHLGFTSLDATVSQTALAMQELAGGHPIKAAGKAVSAPFAPVANYYIGKAVQTEMIEPGKGTVRVGMRKGPGFDAPYNKQLIGEIAKMAQVAGLRATTDPLQSRTFTRNMMRAIHEGGVKGWSNALVRAPFALIEQSLRPIHEGIVPRQKLGVFAGMARHELERLGPNATPAQVREAMARAADSTENRMGQMTYDNLFYNKAVKDMLLIEFRSYGWQLGKYREALGAVADTATTVNRIREGKPILTQRMAYAMALPMVVGLYGAAANYLMTGKRPEGLADYFFPRTGRIKTDGTPERVSLPSYLKDLVSDWHSGISGVPASAYQKLNPWVSIAIDLWNNRDFYNVQIRNPNDPVMNQVMDSVRFALGEAKPFSIAGGIKLSQEGGSSAESWVLPFFGIVPAKAALTQTPAEARAGEIMQGQMSRGAEDRATFNKQQMADQIFREMKSGNPAGERDLAAARDGGKISVEQIRLIHQKMMLTPLQFQVKRMTKVADAMEIWDLANADERKQIRALLWKKIADSKSLSHEEANQYRRVIMASPP